MEGGSRYQRRFRGMERMQPRCVPLPSSPSAPAWPSCSSLFPRQEAVALAMSSCSRVPFTFPILHLLLWCRRHYNNLKIKNPPALPGHILFYFLMCPTAPSLLSYQRTHLFIIFITYCLLALALSSMEAETFFKSFLFTHVFLIT